MEFKNQLSERQAVKRIFGDIVNFFKFLDFKKNLKNGLSPVGKHSFCFIAQC